MIASPITGLARGLNGLVSGLAIALGGVLEQKEAAAPVVEETPVVKAPVEEAPAEEAPATDDSADAEATPGDDASSAEPENTEE